MKGILNKTRGRNYCPRVLPTKPKLGRIAIHLELILKLWVRHKSDFTFKEEWAVNSAYQLLEWIEKRIKWMDGEFVTESTGSALDLKDIL